MAILLLYTTGYAPFHIPVVFYEMSAPRLFVLLGDVVCQIVGRPTHSAVHRFAS